MNENNQNNNLPSEKRFEITYDVHLPNGVVLPEESVEDARHSIEHFRAKYPTGTFKVVRREVTTIKTTLFVDTPQS